MLRGISWQLHPPPLLIFPVRNSSASLRLARFSTSCSTLNGVSYPSDPSVTMQLLCYDIRRCIAQSLLMGDIIIRPAFGLVESLVMRMIYIWAHLLLVLWLQPLEESTESYRLSSTTEWIFGKSLLMLKIFTNPSHIKNKKSKDRSNLLLWLKPSSFQEGNLNTLLYSTYRQINA